MAPSDKKQEALKIGFLEENIEENRSIFEKEFDVVCIGDTSYKELMEVINI